MRALISKWRAKAARSGERALDMSLPDRIQQEHLAQAMAYNACANDLEEALVELLREKEEPRPWMLPVKGVFLISGRGFVVGVQCADGPLPGPKVGETFILGAGAPILDIVGIEKGSVRNEIGLLVRPRDAAGRTMLECSLATTKDLKP